MESKTKQLGNIWIYLTSAIAITSLGISLQFTSWKGSAEIHTLMELTATMLALVIGVFSLLRFYSKKENTYLFIGIGFIGAAFLDGYHAVVTSSFFAGYLPSGLATLIPWSWNASRTFLAALMVLSLWAWRREQRLGTSGQIPERRVYVMVGLLTLGSFLFFTIVPLPRAYYPDFFFGRPEEFVAGILFLVALVGYLKKADWRHDQFENWLVLSLVIGSVCQVVVMSRSFALFDAMFDLAHTLKILSYHCVLTGLSINTFYIYNEAQRSRETLAKSNTSLQEVVSQREQTQEELLVALQSLQQKKEEAETARVAALEQSLRESAILSSATDTIITISSQGMIESINAAGETLFGYRADEVIGENVKMLMPDPHQQEHDSHLEEPQGTDERNAIGIGRATIGKRKDESLFPLELAVSEVQLEDRLLFAGIIRDITERKQAEQQQLTMSQEIEAKSQQIKAANIILQRSNEELKQFAYVASHDLQEPLRKVNSFCQLLQDEYADQLDETAKSYINFAVNGATRMRALVTDLLDFSRVETQGKPLQPTDAGEACAEAIELLQPAIDDSGTKITVQPLPTIQADQSQLVRLFQNLIGNAIKYRGERTPEIQVSVEKQNDDWVISIRDNGIGMEPKYFERIFVMFQRLHARDEYSGTGIGLAICKRIVDRLEGRIWVESELDVGSTFFLMIPKSPSPTEESPSLTEEGVNSHEHCYSA